MRLLRVGYWLGDRAPGWPDVRRFIDPSWDSSERERVADHLRRGFVARAYLGKSRCRLCGDEIGALELSDGTFIWPEGLAHYVELHEVRLPKQFLDHVEHVNEEIEDAEVDEQWWRSQSSLDGP